MNPTFNISTGNSQLDELNKNLQNALTKSQQSQINLYNQQAQNQMASTNQSANAMGLLYSTLPAAVQTQYISDTYTPALAKLASSTAESQTTGVQNVLDTASKIRALNNAANKLNAS